MPSSLILESITRLLTPTIFLFSIWLFASGHNAPGGGFIGGLVAGAALVLAYATGGPRQVRRVVPVPGEILLGAGLGIAQLTTVVPWLFGAQLLESTTIDFEHLPIFGDVHLVTPFFFDLGVYLVVLGLVAKTLTTLGGRAKLPAGTEDPSEVARPTASVHEDRP